MTWTSSRCTRASSGPLQVFEITPGKDGELKVHEIDGTLENILAKYLGLPKVTLIQLRRAATPSPPSASSGTTARTRCASPRA